MRIPLIIKKTAKKGLGVFSVRQFQKGQRVHVLDGDRLRSNQVDERIDAGLETCDDPLQISRLIYIDLDEVSRCINHSCNPNTGIRKENQLYALREILPGDEITYDYSTTVPEYKSWWKMKCFCGEPNCRRIVSSVNTIARQQRAWYLKHHVLPLWVRRFKFFEEP